MRIALPEAFLGAPLPFAGSLNRFAQPSVTPRRARTFAVSTTQARSLDSYREGRSWRDERRESKRNSPNHKTNSDNQQKASGAKEKVHVSLPSALAALNIASVETCRFLVRSGCVRVNGELVRNEKERINRKGDVLNVNGNEYGTLDSALGEQARSTDSHFGDVIDPNVLPRSQRDFRATSKQDPEGTKKYNRRVDGGFYSSRRYNAGK